jgi:hypothetical protein
MRCRASVVRMKSSLVMRMRAARSRKRCDTASVNACGAMPASAAAFSTFCPCSSVPVRKRTGRPSRRAKRAIVSHASVVYACPMCGASLT